MIWTDQNSSYKYTYSWLFFCLKSSPENLEASTYSTILQYKKHFRRILYSLCRRKQPRVLDMSSSFWLFGVDFSHAEKGRSACKADQIHKMTTIFPQNGPKFLFWVKIVVILWIWSVLQAVIYFSAWEKSHDSTPNSPKLEDM